MIANELITLLQKVPPNTKIVVRGYEAGYNDISELKPLRLQKDSGANWYYGLYRDDDSVDAVEAVELFGENEGN